MYMKKAVHDGLTTKNQEFLQIDENLHELLLEAKELFEALDKYSSQVRALEKELQKINAKFPFKLKVKEEPESMVKPALEKHMGWCADGSIRGYTLQDV